MSSEGNGAGMKREGRESRGCVQSGQYGRPCPPITAYLLKHQCPIMPARRGLPQKKTSFSEPLEKSLTASFQFATVCRPVVRLVDYGGRRKEENSKKPTRCGGGFIPQIHRGSAAQLEIPVQSGGDFHRFGCSGRAVRKFCRGGRGHQREFGHQRVPEWRSPLRRFHGRPTNRGRFTA